MERNITKLRRVRKEKGFSSHYALAKACALSGQCIYFWETGHATPRTYNAERLAAVLQTPASTLLEPENQNGARAKAPAPLDQNAAAAREGLSRDD